LIEQERIAKLMEVEKLAKKENLLTDLMEIKEEDDKEDAASS